MYFAWGDFNMGIDEIILYQGSRLLAIIGSDRPAIRENINKPYTEFRRKLSKNSTDDYKSFHVFYDEDNICEAIEFFEEYALALEGKSIMGVARDEIKELLLKLDINLFEDAYGFISKELSLGISCPDGIAETVVVGKKGYYDSLIEGRA